jgi:hypothetical protein
MKARLHRVSKSCILMTYGSRQRCPKGRAPQPRARFAAAVRAIARCRRALGARLFHLSATGVSILAACPGTERAGRGWRVKVSVHGEVAAQFDPTGAVVRIRQKALDQRSGPASVARAAATRARSWLSRSRLNHALFTGSIGSIGCCRRSWPKPIRCCFPINVGRSRSRNPPSEKRRR